MSEARFTPGPWGWHSFGGRMSLVTETGGAKVILIPQGRSQIQTRDPETGLLRPIRPEDNVARLAAAAPDLLTALRLLHERYVMAIGNEGPECYAARAAIAKATGASP